MNNSQLSEAHDGLAARLGRNSLWPCMEVLTCVISAAMQHGVQTTCLVSVSLVYTKH